MDAGVQDVGVCLAWKIVVDVFVQNIVAVRYPSQAPRHVQRLRRGVVP